MLPNRCVQTSFRRPLWFPFDRLFRQLGCTRFTPRLLTLPQQVLLAVFYPPPHQTHNSPRTIYVTTVCVIEPGSMFLAVCRNVQGVYVLVPSPRRLRPTGQESQPVRSNAPAVVWTVWIWIFVLWSVTSVERSGTSKFAHDSLLQNDSVGDNVAALAFTPTYIDDLTRVLLYVNM